jgi:hypothetical protein
MAKRKSLDPESEKENGVLAKMRKADSENQLLAGTRYFNAVTNIIKNRQVVEVHYDENNNPIENSPPKEKVKALRVEDIFEKHEEKTEAAESSKKECTGTFEMKKEQIEYTFSNSNISGESQEQSRSALSEFKVNKLENSEVKSEGSSIMDENSCKDSVSTQSDIYTSRDEEEIINETIQEQVIDDLDDAVKQSVEFILERIENSSELGESTLSNMTPKTKNLNETYVISVKSIEKPPIETQDSFIKFEKNRIKENWLIELSGILKNQKIEHFVAAECIHLPTTIGLNVEGLGLVSLPLIDSQAQQLIQMSEHDTRVVKNEFNSYEIDHSLIKITHPNWNEQLNNLIKIICDSMGCVGMSCAKLEKMILYTKDSRFVQKNNQVKEKSKFATLILQLPSIYEGGQLKLLEKEFDIGQSKNRSPYFIHYAAHYANLEHEILPIKAGTRLDLVYSLEWTHEFGYCPNVNQCVKSRLAEFLHKVNEVEKKLALTLQGSSMNFAFPHNGFRGLKGIDAQRLNLLLEANDRLAPNDRFVFYIAHVNMDVYSLEECEKLNETSNDYLHPDNEEHFKEDNELTPYEKKKMPKIVKWYDQNGVVMFETLRKSVEFFDEIIDPIAENTQFTDVKYWTLKFTQSRCVSKIQRLEKYKRTYGRYLLAFWPQTKNFDYLIGSDPLYGIEFLTSTKISSDDPLFAKYLDITLKGLIEQEEIQFLGNSTLVKFLPILLKNHNNLEMCQNLISRYIKELNDLFYDVIFGFIQKYGWLNMKESLRKAIVNTNSIAIICILVDVNRIFFYFLLYSKSYDLLYIYIFKNMFNSVSPEDALDCFNEFVRPFLDNLVEHTKPLSISNYTSLLKSMFRFPNNYSDIEKINKHLLRNTDIEFVKSLIKEMRKLLPKTQLKHFKVLISHCINLISGQITKLGEFTWCMPYAELPGHREVEKFLRSDQQTILYTNVFSSIHDAREFAHSYGGTKPTYSVQIVPEGRGRNSFVHIIKTNAYHASRSRQTNDLKSEQEELNLLLSELESC